MSTSSKYSYMTDEEFVKFADRMVGDDIQREAVARLGKKLIEQEDASEKYQEKVSSLKMRVAALELELDELDEYA